MAEVALQPRAPDRRLVRTRLALTHARLLPGVGRPLVLLHMSPRSSRMFAALQPLLARPTIALDRAGYGYSDPPSLPQPMLGDYADAVIEAVNGLGIGGPFDVLGMHTGSVEAVEVAHRAAGRVRRCGIVAVPVFTADERADLLQKFGELRVRPVEDGSHLLDAWRARFQFRHPPFDLDDVQRRFVDYVLAPWPGQAYQAVFRYDFVPRLQSLPCPLVAFAPDDDLGAITRRSRDLVPAGTRWVDLPQSGVDLFTVEAARMARLIDEHLPADA